MPHQVDKNWFKINLREVDFLLWEQLDLENTLFKLNTFSRIVKKEVKNRFLEMKNFACQKLGVSYQASDRDGCKLLEDGTVELPKAYPQLWKEYRKILSSNRDDLNLPPVLVQLINEMLMGANPAFMTYSGFSIPAADMIEKFGTLRQKELFCDKLRAVDWAACLCLTEPQAGSDISTIETMATPNIDGTYSVQGEKIFISAGMHQLTENTIYFVLGKTKVINNNYGLCCFVIPKFWINDDSTLGDFNHVSCISLADKMGLNGCANAHLQFGATGDCRAYLLGEQENIGLLQFISMMNQARIATGTFALGISSAAYLNSVAYARHRIQGKQFIGSFNSKSDRVPIIAHYDVQRMLLEMKSKVEGIRMLIAKVAFYESIMLHYRENPSSKDNDDKIYYYDALISILTPIVKAYASDEAWRICELAIQIHGGNGYIKEFPVEQYARDVKVLSIWEGTNYIQSQYLLRDKLRMGANMKIYNVYLQEAKSILDKVELNLSFQNECKVIREALATLEVALKLFNSWVKTGKMWQIPGYATIFLKMMAKCSLALYHLEAMDICYTQSKNEHLNKEDIVFYEGKIASARFYIQNILSSTKYDLEMIQSDSFSSCSEAVFAADQNPHFVFN